MPTQQPIPDKPVEARLEFTQEAALAANRFIHETDWSAFWYRVTERTSPQIDAYERARVKSLETAPQHVFM